MPRLDLEQERARLQAMRRYEDGYSLETRICGVDEVGRGPLAGPVVAGAVILPRDAQILYLNDSKKLTPKRREALDREIREKALAVGIGVVDSQVIDRINILQATYEAMRRAIDALALHPQVLLVDAVEIPGIDLPQVPLVKGDEKSVSIAAASVVAKVYRDRMMEEAEALYPGYGFARNKGYGTAEHIRALGEKGPCPLHRQSFITRFVSKDGKETS